MKKYLKLNKKTSIEIHQKVPFDFNATVFKPSHYPDPLKIYARKILAVGYIWEDIFWQRKQGKQIPRLEKKLDYEK